MGYAPSILPACQVSYRVSCVRLLRRGATPPRAPRWPMPGTHGTAPLHRPPLLQAVYGSVPVQPPTLGTPRDRGQKREAYGRLPRAGGRTGWIVFAPPGLRQYAAHQAQPFDPGRAGYPFCFGAFPAPRIPRAAGWRRLSSPAAYRRTGNTPKPPAAFPQQILHLAAFPQRQPVA